MRRREDVQRVETPTARVLRELREEADLLRRIGRAHDAGDFALRDRLGVQVEELYRERGMSS